MEEECDNQYNKFWLLLEKYWVGTEKNNIL
jgi:hypothetical protein